MNHPVDDPDNRFRGQLNRVRYCTSLTSDKVFTIRKDEIHVNFRVNSSIRQRGFKIVIDYPNA